MEKKSKQFTYRVNVRWQSQRRGVMSIQGKPDIEVATPPEFMGHAGIWSPEDLFVASATSCIMTTFLYYADRERLSLISYDSHAEGILEKVEGEFRFSRIKVLLTLKVGSNEDIIKAKRLVELSEKNCLISNSIKSKVEVIADVLSGEF